jgi:hypothetical protein
MKKRLLNKLKKLAKKKYIYLAYYQDEKQCVKRYNQNQLRIKLVKWLFSFHLTSIEFLLGEPISNIYGIKFSNNEVETFETIDDWYSNIYTEYINYDAKNENKGCINQVIKGNTVIFKRNVTCLYEIKSYKPDDILKKENKIVTLVKTTDFECETINYDKIEVNKSLGMFKLYGKEYLIKQKKKRRKKRNKEIIVTQNLEDLKKCYCKN